MARSETVAGVCEHIEGTYGEAMEARDAFVRLKRGCPGLGQPDLCWLRKVSSGSLLKGPQCMSAYHWVLGKEVRGEASLAAGFFVDLTNRLESSALRSLVAPLTQQWRIDSGLYCAYDFFSGCDVRVTVSIPGGVEACAIDGDGESHDVTEAMWRGLAVSSFLRFSPFDSATVAKLGCVQVYQDFQSLKGEAAVLEVIADFYRGGQIQEARALMHHDPHLGHAAEDFDPVASCVLHHFQRLQRFRQAFQFFQGILQYDPAIGIYIASIQRELALKDEANKTLAAALAAAPESPHVLVALGDLELHRKRTDRALAHARAAVELDAEYRPGWILLCKVYNEMGSPALVLCLMNQAPPPPEDLELDELFPELPEPAEGRTFPAEVPFDADEELALLVASEIQIAGREELTTLTGNALFPAFLPDKRIAPHVQPARLVYIVRLAFYEIVVDLASSIGWEAFLDLRADVFVMDREVESGDEEEDGSDAASSTTDGDAASLEGGGGKEVEDTAPDQRLYIMKDGVKGLEGELSSKVAVSGPTNKDGSFQVAVEGYEEFLEEEDEEEGGQGPIQGPLGPPLGPGPVMESVQVPEEGGAGPAGPPEGASKGTEEAEGSSEEDEGSAVETETPGAEPDGEAAMEGTDPGEPADGKPAEGAPEADCEAREGGSADEDEVEMEVRDGVEDEDGAGSERKRFQLARANLEKDLSKADMDGKHVCEVWLDELIHALYEDLSEYIEFKIFQKNTLADDSDDFPSEKEDTHTNSPLTNPSQADWHRLGALCERLLQLDDAEKCYRMSVHLGFSAIAWLALARIYSLWEWPKETLHAAREILVYLSDASSAFDPRKPPQVVTAAISSIIAHLGLQRVRSVQEAIEPDVHPSLNHIFLEAVRWHTVGYDG